MDPLGPLRSLVKRNRLTLAAARALRDRLVLPLTDRPAAARLRYLRDVRAIARDVREHGLAAGCVTEQGEFFIRTWDGLQLYFNHSDPRGPAGDGQRLDVRSEQAAFPLETYLMESLGPSAVYLDVGANNGYFYALKVARLSRHSTVFAFEPDREILGHLRRNVAVNGLADRITIVDTALGDSVTEARLTDNRAAMGHLATPGEASGPLVRVDTLDHFIASRSVGHVDWIKVDIEGGEHSFVRGARGVLSAHRPRLIVEVRDEFLRRAGSSARALLDDLGGLGYWCAHASGTSDVLAVPEELVGAAERQAAWLTPARP